MKYLNKIAFISIMMMFAVSNVFAAQEDILPSHNTAQEVLLFVDDLEEGEYYILEETQQNVNQEIMSKHNSVEPLIIPDDDVIQGEYYIVSPLLVEGELQSISQAIIEKMVMPLKKTINLLGTTITVEEDAQTTVVSMLGKQIKLNI